VVVHGVESWRVINGERGMCVLAVKTFLISVNPIPQFSAYKSRFPELVGSNSLHCFPIEVSFILNAAAVREFRKVDLRQQRFQIGEELMKTWGIIRQGRKKQSCWCDIAP
jgi:hypothetical protein